MSKRLIWAEDAIDAVHNLYAIFGSEGEWVDRKDVFEAINSLPSAQPEIVKCKKCRYVCYDEEFGNYWCNRMSDSFKVEADGYCKWGK